MSSIRHAATQLAGIIASYTNATTPPALIAFRGEIAGYNPADGSVRVSYTHVDDEPTVTQWIPLITPMAIAGYGIGWGVEEGAQVLLLELDPTGDHCVALGFTTNDVDTAMNVPPTEWWIKDKRGSFIKFTVDGAESGDGQGGIHINAESYFGVTAALSEFGEEGLDAVIQAAWRNNDWRGAFAWMWATLQTQIALGCQAGTGGSIGPAPTPPDFGSQKVRIAD